MKNLYFLAFFGLVVCINGDAHSVTIECSQFFVGGKKPITNYADQEICLKGYSLAFSHKTLGNSYSAEYLTKEQVEKSRTIRRYGLFDNRDPIIGDYRNSGYDRGHMTPSGDMSEYASQVQTFRYENLVPQTRRLNSGKWNWIENQTRQMAIRYDRLYIVTGPFFSGDVQKIGNDHVWVPSATWKAIYIPKTNQSGVYFCTNTSAPTCYVLSVSFFTKQTGIDPFPALTQSVKDVKANFPTIRKKRSRNSFQSQ